MGIWRKLILDLADWDKCSCTTFFRTKQFFEEDVGIWHHCDGIWVWVWNIFSVYQFLGRI